MRPPPSPCRSSPDHFRCVNCAHLPPLAAAMSTPHHACIAMGSNRSVSGIKIKSLSLPSPTGRHVRPCRYGCCITRIPIRQWAFPPDAHARSLLPSANFHHLFTSSLSVPVHLLLLAAARSAITSSTIDKGIPSDARAMSSHRSPIYPPPSPSPTYVPMYVCT